MSHQYLKKTIVMQWITIAQVISYLICPKSFKDVCICKCKIILKAYFLKTNAALQCSALPPMLEKQKQCVTTKKVFGTLPKDLSKAFKRLSIAKLNTYVLGWKSSKLANDYLSNRKQRVKINTQFSGWSDVLTGVPRGSILGLLLFNIHYVIYLFKLIIRMWLSMMASHLKSAVTVLMKLFKASKIFPKHCLNTLKEMKGKVILADVIYV